jgi:hypothetical protein
MEAAEPDVAQTIQVPAELLKKILLAGEALDDLHDAFEDYLIATNPALIKKLRKARKEHRFGKARPFDELKRELNLA